MRRGSRFGTGSRCSTCRRRSPRSSDELDAAIAQRDRPRQVRRRPGGGEFEAAWAEFCGARTRSASSSGTRGADARAQGRGRASGRRGHHHRDDVHRHGRVDHRVRRDPRAGRSRPRHRAAHARGRRAAITERTTALVPVHLYGQPVDIDGFRALADRHGLILAEDAAQAHGAPGTARRAGASGDVAAFSFFPGKNLGAFGDAGGVTTAGRRRWPRACAKIRDHGRDRQVPPRRDRHQRPAGHAAGRDPLGQADQAGGVERRSPARRPRSTTRPSPAPRASTPIVVGAGAVACYHQYVVRVDERDAVLAALQGRAASRAGVHYPIPLHRQPALQAENCVAGELPNAERARRDRAVAAGVPRAVRRRRAARSPTRSSS